MRLKYFVALAIVVIVSAAMVVFAQPPAGSGSITGKVTYTGTPPKMKPIDMSKEPSCAKQHATPVLTQNVTTGPGNSLQWVVVYISAGEQGASALPPRRFATTRRAANIFRTFSPWRPTSNS